MIPPLNLQYTPEHFVIHVECKSFRDDKLRVLDSHALNSIGTIIAENTCTFVCLLRDDFHTLCKFLKATQACPTSILLLRSTSESGIELPK
jgi:hypothetical protein